MEPSKPKLHPLILTAAASVIVFSLVGVAAVTGLIPGVFSKSNPAQPAPPASDNAAPAAAAQPAGAETSPAAQAPAPEVTEPARKLVARHTPSRQHVARTDAYEPPPPPAPRAAEQPKPCASCGEIDTIRAIDKEGEGSGLGVVAGGVAGALLGHQVGGGTGKDLATIAGAVGGGFVGNKVEKNLKKTRVYEITVRMEDGSYRTITQPTEPAFRPGDKVKLVDGNVVAR
jgi:outer membrane lipoprotein SlyB